MCHACINRFIKAGLDDFSLFKFSEKSEDNFLPLCPYSETESPHNILTLSQFQTQKIITNQTLVSKYTKLRWNSLYKNIFGQNLIFCQKIKCNLPFITENCSNTHSNLTC